MEAKRARHVAEKERIGRAAAGLVRPGDSILLDSGTTTVQIARFLPDDEDITVVTNDFGVLSALASKNKINVVMVGGMLRRKNMAFYGSQAEATIDALLIDWLFLGVDGFDVEGGITTHYEPEAILNRKMASVAKRVVAVTDASKFGRTCLHRIVGVEEIDLMISDSSASAYFDSLERPVPCDVKLV